MSDKKKIDWLQLLLLHDFYIFNIAATLRVGQDFTSASGYPYHLIQELFNNSHQSFHESGRLLSPILYIHLSLLLFMLLFTNTELLERSDMSDIKLTIKQRKWRWVGQEIT